MDLLDGYVIRARLFPAMLAIAPSLVFLLVLVSTSKNPLGLPQILTSVTVGVLFFAFADLARRFGKRVEKYLFPSTSGRPFPTVLRHCDTNIDARAKARYHAFLARAVGENAPTALEENEAPDVADSFYALCGNYLREQTRDQSRFSVLFAENVSYGFRRNLYGVKWVGLLLNLATVGASLWLVRQSGGAALSQYGVVLIVAAVHAVYFLFGVTWKSVSDASNQYGRQLVLSCETLMKETS